MDKVKIVGEYIGSTVSPGVIVLTMRVDREKMKKYYKAVRKQCIMDESLIELTIITCDHEECKD